MMTAKLNTTWSRRSRRLRIQNVRVIPTRADSESLRENEKRSGLIARAHRVNALARGCHWQYYGCSSESESASESLASSACQSRVTVPGHWLGTLLQCQPGRGPGPGLRAAAPASEPEVYPVISTSSASESSAAAPPARRLPGLTCRPGRRQHPGRRTRRVTAHQPAALRPDPHLYLQRSTHQLAASVASRPGCTAGARWLACPVGDGPRVPALRGEGCSVPSAVSAAQSSRRRAPAFVVADQYWF